MHTLLYFQVIFPYVTHIKCCFLGFLMICWRHLKTLVIQIVPVGSENRNWVQRGTIQATRQRWVSYMGGGALTYIHVLSSSSKVLQIQPLTGISLMWNDDPYHRYHFKMIRAYPFHWPIKNTHPYHIPLAQTITKNWPLTPIFPFFVHLPYFMTLIAVRMSVPLVWKPYPFPPFCSQMTTCLARVTPWAFIASNLLI